MALKNTSVDLVPDVSWYYEEPSHIEIVYWATERDGYKKAHHIRIPWRKLKASVERKYGGLTKRPPDLGQAVARDDNQGDAPSRVMQKLGVRL